jgi:hypothetical protein
MIEVRTPVNQFFDTDGSPLDAGYIYIGTTGANPETNPQTVYWDKAGTIPAAQPLRTLNGYPSRDGAVSKFYTATKNYSITVKDKRGILVMGVLNSDSGVFDELSETTGAAAVGYDNAVSGLAATDVQAAVDELDSDIEALETTVDGLELTTAGVVNLFANSAFLINQRAYVSGAATASPNQYTIDRIRVVTSGQSLSWVAGTFGNKITAPAGGAEQVIEGTNITGGDYVCTWVGTGTIQINGVTTEKLEQFTLPAGTNATVRMFGEFEQFMLTRQNMIGQYEYSHSNALAFCKRYYSLTTFVITIYNQAINQSWGYGISFPVEMRAIPTLSILSGAVSGGSSLPTVDSGSIRGARVFFIAGPATAAAQASGIVQAVAEL